MRKTMTAFGINSPVSANLTSDGAVSLGSFGVYCWVSDANGDGIVDDSDYVEVFTGGRRGILRIRNLPPVLDL